MDQKPLVESQIDDGFKLAKTLVAGGFDVAAAFWVCPTEDGQWTFYLASKVFDEKGPAIAYRKVADAMQKLDDPWLSMSETKVIGEKNPITAAVLGILRKHPGPMATRSRRPLLGNIEIDEVYIYPPVEGAARTPPPRVKVTGLKKVQCGTAVKEESEVIGFVEGFIGEAEFNTRFADLIKEKYGSPEQFAHAFPRIVLEEVDPR
jgi:hypothetical protein